MKGVKFIMQSKKIKSVIACLGFMLSGICAFGIFPVNSYAQETVASGENLYRDDILSADISAQDKSMLLNEKKLQEQHNELLEEGWVLQDIDVEDCEIYPTVLEIFKRMRHIKLKRERS